MLEEQLQSLADKMARNDPLTVDETASIAAIQQILAHGFDPRSYFTPDQDQTFPRVAADIALYARIEQARAHSTQAKALETTANQAGISITTAKRVYERVRNTYFEAK